MPSTRKRPKRPKTPPNIHATWARNRWAFRARVTVEGKRIEGPLRRTITEAREDRDQLSDERRLPTPERLLTLEEGMQLVLHDLQVKQAPQETVRYYQWQFRVLWRAFRGEVLLHALTVSQVEAFIRKRLNRDGVSPNTVNKHLQALQRILNLAVRKGFLPGNPIAHVSRPRNRTKESPWLTQNDVHELLGAVLDSGNPQAQRDHDVMAFFYLTGLRITEACRVQACSIDLQNGLVQVSGKTGYREIPICDDLRPILFRFLAGKEPSNFLLPNKNTIQCLFQRWRERRNDRRLNARSLRHAFGSRLAQAGRTAHQIARLMGNGIKQSDRYLHASGPQLREAISAVSLSSPVPDVRSAASD